MSLLFAIGAVVVLRGLGFVGMLAGTRVPAALLVPYAALIAALAFGYWGISRGVIIEPPAFIVDAITGFMERMSERSARLTGADAMIAGTLSRYFGLRFFNAVFAVFVGAMTLVAMIDFIEMLRRTGDMKDVSALLVAKITVFRLLFVTERIMPFAVLVGAMSCYLNLSRRLELVVAGRPASRPGNSLRPPWSLRC